MKSEWTKFYCTIPKPDQKGWTTSDCSLLARVYHVAHVPEALRIIEDHRLSAGLINDESRLKATRTSVVWFSANTWVNGSIYGTVQFGFDWEDLINGRRFYWVEDIAYKNPAYRILVTDRDLSNSDLVHVYDPSVDDGPLRYRAGKWFWNGQKTSEFMIDCDVSLSLCKEIDFIRHKIDGCSDYGSACKELKTREIDTGARVLAYLLGRDLTTIAHCLSRTSDGKTSLAFYAQFGFDHLYHELANQEVAGSLSSPSHVRRILRAALLQYGHGQFDQARGLVRLLQSEQVLKDNLEHIIRKYLEMKDFKLD